MTSELMQRATRLRLVEVTEDGKVRIADRQALETEAAVAPRRAPRLRPGRAGGARRHIDEVAQRFVRSFDDYLQVTTGRRTRHGSLGRRVPGAATRPPIVRSSSQRSTPASPESLASGSGELVEQWDREPP